MSARTALPLVLLGILIAAPADAHRLAPSYLGITLQPDGRADVHWKVPRLVARGARLEPVLPDACSSVGESRTDLERAAWVIRFALDCGHGGLVGRTVGVDGLDTSGTNALLHVTLSDGREVRAVLSGASPRFAIPPAESRIVVLRGYLLLGAAHLLGGADHLIFVLGLLLLMPSRRKLVTAVSAFTLGHSATLALAALGVLRTPQALVELAIAASLIALAAEALGPAPQRSLLVRRAGLVPFGFGLVHGLGFAGALAQLGLPGHAIPLALLAFNIGIELAQLGVVLLAWPAMGWLRRARSWPRPLAELPATAVGTLGVFWCLQRTLDWLQPL